MNERVERLIAGLPDPDAARRFLGHLAEASPGQFTKLLKNDGLLSDVLTLVAFSPLLTTTLLQNPNYITWLDRKRRESGVCSREDLLESLGQFSLTNSQLEPQVVFARFRRRELLRIYLRDIRGLATTAEITEEISNLADAVLESALRLAEREMDDRFGRPIETGDKGRTLHARFCIASLGKLGSRELNYSSDIDLLFLYSSEGSTAGGAKGTVTNREYFGKLAEYCTKFVGQPSGEGAAYRVDLRLRPHGTLGPLALSVNDLVRYYEEEARPWERQVMIRSRSSAGDRTLFRTFFARIEDLVFPKEMTPESALANVRRSKEEIDLQQPDRKGFDLKLGKGGIREIEFIAQALQMAYAGNDKWLRAPHTLISLDRLKDRGHLSEKELTQLVAAYAFLRRGEHILQMENGLQTHAVPEDETRRKLFADRMHFAGGGRLEKGLAQHTGKVARIFDRVFGHTGGAETALHEDAETELPDTEKAALDRSLPAVSPHLSGLAKGAMTSAPQTSDDIDLAAQLRSALSGVNGEHPFREKLAALRRTWAAAMVGIAGKDYRGEIDLFEAKRRQTQLAEATIQAGLEIVRSELEVKYDAKIVQLPLAVLALGKLGGGGVDYESDLDLLFVYDDDAEVPARATSVEFFSRAAELFVTTLSSMTRDGHLYRIDLRLRPYGSKGLSAIGSKGFLSYMRDTAAIWEMLAFVKLRAVGGDLRLAERIESATREIIHVRAAAASEADLRAETLRVRDALEEQRSRIKRGGDVDIKYGSGGMLDVYFAIRYLQLRDNIPDEAEDRATTTTLRRLRDSGSLDEACSDALADGYRFLSSLDHAMRLLVGRSTRIPSGNETAMKAIAARLGFERPASLVEKLTLHRIAIREAYETVLGIKK